MGLADGTLAPIAPSAGAIDPVLDWRFDRIRSAPVCPRCIAKGLPHQKGWRHALVTACVRHGVRLVDECPRCHARITPHDGGLKACSCGLPYARIECTSAEPGELALASVLTGEVGKDRVLLAPTLHSAAPPDIARFIFFLASHGRPSRTGKQGKARIPITVAESRAFLTDTAAVLTDWPHRFDEHVRIRLLNGSGSGTSAPARLGNWYQGLMRFRSATYTPFRERLAHVIALHFDGAYSGTLSTHSEESAWISAAEASRLLQVRADRIKMAIDAGELTSKVYAGGFGHRQWRVQRADIQAAAATRRGFVDRKAAAGILGVGRAQMRLLEDAELIRATPKKDMPAFADGDFDVNEIVKLHQAIASRASARSGETLAFREINLRRTTDRSSLIAVFRAIRDGKILPVAAGDDLGSMHFVAADIADVLRQTGSAQGWTTQEVARFTGWKEQCIAHWCRTGLLPAQPYPHGRTTAFIISPSDLSIFQAAYIPLAVLAKQIGSSSRALLARLEQSGIKTEGAFRDGNATRGHLVRLSKLIGMRRET